MHCVSVCVSAVPLPAGGVGREGRGGGGVCGRGRSGAGRVGVWAAYTRRSLRAAVAGCCTDWAHGGATAHCAPPG